MLPLTVLSLGAALPCFTALYRALPCFTALYQCSSVLYRALPVLLPRVFVVHRGLPWSTIGSTVDYGGYRGLPWPTVHQQAVP